MTTLAGRPAGDARTQRRTTTGTSSADVPVLVSGTHLFGAQPGSGYKTPPALVRRVDGQVLQLTPLLYAVLEAVDGTRDVHAVAATAGRAVGRHLHGDDVRMLVEEKLRPLGLVCLDDGSVCDLKKANPLLALRPRVVVSKPELTRRVTAPFALLFNPVIMALATVAFAVVAFWVLFDKGLASAAYDAFHTPGLLLAVFAITVVSAGFHEFGHAAALRRGGGTPGAMGAGFYLVWPAFYTDVTDSYRLGRAARLRTDVGGLYFNALVALAMYCIWLASRWDGLLLVIAAQILQMIRQLPPLVRFDGYHLLADVVGVPDLFHRIGPTLRSFVPGRRAVEALELKLWARVVIALWVLLVVPLLLVTAVLAVVALPRIIGTTWHSVRGEAQQIDAAFADGSWAAVGVRALAIAALVVPVAGIVYMLLRAARRLVTSMRRRTAGHPIRRTLAIAGVVAALGGLALAWWPREGAYRPIESGERGTLQDAMFAVASDPVATAGTSDATSASVLPALEEGEHRSVTTVWPADARELGTQEQPQLAVVMVPRTESPDAPTWVFPFDRPDAPLPEDNQSLAVVTTDGGTVYDVAFALVWADGDAVLNSNEAYAFASCTECTAVAVSFQVVLVVGDANLAAPENIAEAVAYNCIRCVTEALAVQLVVSLPDGLDADSATALEQLWLEIAEFGENLEGLSLTEIQAALADYEEQILWIVDPEYAATTGSTATPEPAASTAEPSQSPSDTPTSAVSDSPEPASSEGSATPSATTTPSPPSTETATPTPSAS
jgi:putative peptide zinc metalloprotease protein